MNKTVPFSMPQYHHNHNSHFLQRCSSEIEFIVLQKLVFRIRVSAVSSGGRGNMIKHQGMLYHDILYRTLPFVDILAVEYWTQY